jgi:hypothetical protein
VHIAVITPQKAFHPIQQGPNNPDLYLSISIYIYLYLSISINIYLYLSISIYIYLYLYLSILSIYLTILFVLSIYLSIYLFIYLSIYLFFLSILSIHLFIYLSIYLSIYLFLSWLWLVYRNLGNPMIPYLGFRSGPAAVLTSPRSHRMGRLGEGNHAEHQRKPRDIGSFWDWTSSYILIA